MEVRAHEIVDVDDELDSVLLAEATLEEHFRRGVFKPATTPASGLRFA